MSTFETMTESFESRLVESIVIVNLKGQALDIVTLALSRAPIDTVGATAVLKRNLNRLYDHRSNIRISPLGVRWRTFAFAALAVRLIDV